MQKTELKKILNELNRLGVEVEDETFGNDQLDSLIEHIDRTISSKVYDSSIFSSLMIHVEEIAVIMNEPIEQVEMRISQQKMTTSELRYIVGELLK